MSSSAPDGHTLRQGRDDDLVPLTELFVAEEIAVRGESQWGIDDTREWLRTDGDRGELWVADAADGRIAGALGIIQRDDLFNGWLVVAPAHFDSNLDEVLLDRTERSTRDRGGARLYADTYAENQAARDLYTRHGYAEERRHYLMQIDFESRPEEPTWPDGISWSTFDPDRDARAFHAAMNDSFEGQWGFRGMPFDDWLRFRIASPDFDPDVWLVARDGHDVAGVLRGDPKRLSCGWIGMVGVRPRWQRRGIGTALIKQAFCAFYDRGERCVGLGVDTRNPTNATVLYERLGMRVKLEEITYVKELS